MIHVEQHGPVLAIRMARGFLGRPLAWTTAYWVDGLLIDTRTAGNLDGEPAASALGLQPVRAGHGARRGGPPRRRGAGPDFRHCSAIAQDIQLREAP